MKPTLVFTLAAVLWPLALASAQDDAALAQAKANEQRLRDTLRTTTQQLRAAEAEKATLLAGQTERDEKIAELEARAARLVQDLSDEKAAAAQSRAELEARVLKGEQEAARLNATLAKWKAAYTQAADVAKKTEAERVRLNSANIALERKVADREWQNLELYKTGREILQRYASFGLGRAIAAREPFTGIAKARLEAQVQDYADALEDSKLQPAPADGKPSTQPASPPAAKPKSKAASSHQSQTTHL